METLGLERTQTVRCVWLFPYSSARLPHRIACTRKMRAIWPGRSLQLARCTLRKSDGPSKSECGARMCDLGPGEIVIFPRNCAQFAGWRNRSQSEQRKRSVEMPGEQKSQREIIAHIHAKCVCVCVLVKFIAKCTKRTPARTRRSNFRVIFASSIV